MNKKITLLILLMFSFGFAQTKSLGTTTPQKSFKTAVSITSNVPNGSWSNAASWSPAQVPTGSDDVTILPGQTINVDINGAQVNNLTLNNTANLNINVGKSLTINGVATNSGVFTVDSDASSSGSVILLGPLGGGGGIDRYNRYLTGGLNNWHLISSPLAFAKLSDFITNNGAGMTTSGVQYSLGTYNNTGTPFVDLWTNYTTDNSNPAPTSAFVAGMGYEILMNASGTVLFTGAIKTGNASIVATAGNTRWNLVGNPYTSYMYANINANATNFLTTNSENLDPSFVSMYMWNPVSQLYDVVNQASAAQTHAPGQAFFIKAKVGGETLNFTTTMQTHSGTNFQKVKTTGIPNIILSVDNNTGKVIATEIKYMGGTTLGLDPGYDAGLFDGIGTSNFSVYTHLVEDNQVDFALQVVPDNSFDTTIIPVGLNAGSGTQVTFKVNATDLPLGKKVFIEDKLLNTVTELNNSDKTYTVTLTSDLSGVGRFYLHTQDNVSTLAVEDFNTAQYTLIASPKNNNLKLYGAVSEKGSIVIYDTLGRAIYTTSLKKGTEQDIVIPDMATGVYFVKASIDGKPLSKKIVWY